MLLLRVAACAVVVALCLAACGARADEDGYEYKVSGCLKNGTQSAWMKKLPDNTPIFTNLTIPGTHDSSSFVYKALDVQQCHCATYMDQLNAGIRFIDLRLVMISGKLRLSHGELPTTTFSLAFEEAFDDITGFLRNNPSEMVVARVSYESPGVEGGVYAWDDAVVQTAFDQYANFATTSCSATSCLLGNTRGKIAYFAQNWRFSFLPGASYGSTFNVDTEQDVYDVPQQEIYRKWEAIRSTMIFASSNPRSGGIINYVSNAGLTFPYFFASGRSSPRGPSLWTGKSFSCTSSQNTTSIDFPRKDCTCVKNKADSICSLHYKGLNAMTYEWIDNGLNGLAQSREVDYVFPQHLGIIAMDFPSQALISRIIDVNFASAPTPPSEPRIAVTCGKQCSCLAGDAGIETASGAVVAARDVAVGDVIAGKDEGQWCTVVAAGAVANGTAYGEFTADHFVVGADGAVAPHGAVGAARAIDLVNIATDCPAARTAKQTVFTPLSSVFCRDALSWTEYVAMYGALMRIMANTGAFWFNPYQYSSPNAAPGTQGWAAGLPAICHSLVGCVMNETGCAAFETGAAAWIASYLPADKSAVVRAAYPNLGDVHAPSGNLIASVLSAHDDAAE